MTQTEPIIGNDEYCECCGYPFNDGQQAYYDEVNGWYCSEVCLEKHLGRTL